MSDTGTSRVDATNGVGTVVVGGGLAAAHCVHTLREGGYAQVITVVAEENEVPYERPPLSKGYLQGNNPASELAPYPESWYTENDVDLRLYQRVESINTASKLVLLSDGSTVGYENLVLATGCRSRLGGSAALAGWDLPGVHTLRSLEDSTELKERLVAGKHLVIVGAGWIGMEVAASARSIGVQVTVITPDQIPLAKAMGFEFGSHLAQLHTEHGVQFRFGAAVSSVEAGENGNLLVQTPTGGVKADLVLLAIGAVPNVELAAAAGLDLGTGILVDEYLRTSNPNILAVGDIAEARNTTLGRSLRVEHWDNAMRQGKLAAATILGQEETYDWLPYFFTDQFDMGMEFVGDRNADDDVVVRGDMAKGEFIIFWLRKGILTAAMNVNIWDVNEHLRSMIGTSIPVADLQDEGSDLFSL